jgi:hypothetical protein
MINIGKCECKDECERQYIDELFFFILYFFFLFDFF